MEAESQGKTLDGLSCELEDWFHILDSDRVPRLDEWNSLELRVERNTERLLELLHRTGVRATFFSLGWIAERVPQLIRRCRSAGHEIGSHGYGHVLAYQVGRRAFRQDIARSKRILEDILGEEVIGFRSPGFCVRRDNRWVFDVVAQAGFRYDASVFPAHHGHGGLPDGPPHPHVLETSFGPLVEIPTSTVPLFGRQVCLFGGGYLRISPLPLIRWGVRKLHGWGQPLIVYVHPREVDPDHPRLPLDPWRKFKCYTNLRTTMPKLQWLCEHHRFTTLSEIAANVAEQFACRWPDARPAERSAPQIVAVRPAASARSPASTEYASTDKEYAQS
jgi:polysaccharide deacetylase family protein (PEP-CTERM system associated)